MKNLYLLFSIAFVLLTACKTHENTKIEVSTLIKTSQSWDGTSLPEYPEGKPEVTMLKVTIPPHTKLPMHNHPVINAGVILKGELTVMSENNDTLYLKEGDPIVELVDTEHYGINEGTEPVEAIVFYAGIKGTPVTVVKDGEDHHQ